MQIIMYTTHCPRCRVVEMKLKQKNIDYIECADIDEMKKLGIVSAPYLKIDDKLFNFSEAVAWINNFGKDK